MLIGVEEDLWQRMKVRAAEERRAVKDVAVNAFKLYLTQNDSGTKAAATGALKVVRAVTYAAPEDTF